MKAYELLNKLQEIKEANSDKFDLFNIELVIHENIHENKRIYDVFANEKYIEIVIEIM